MATLTIRLPDAHRDRLAAMAARGLKLIEELDHRHAQAPDQWSRGCVEMYERGMSVASRLIGL